MLTVLDAIQKSTEYLERKSIDSPRMNAELLLTHVLNCKRLDLYLKYDRPLIDDELDDYRDCIARRGKSEPLQYITGKVDFFDLTLKVNNHVLIPRQETENLIEAVLNECANKSNLRILEVGTGSGNIAIALSKNLPGAQITSIDVSAEALSVAKENATLNDVNGQINFEKQSIFEFASQYKFDIVVSNPPYVSVEEYKSLQKEIVEHEPKAAVTDNSDGYSFYKAILEKCEILLNKKGIVAFEMAKGHSNKLKELLSDHSFTEIKVIEDYQKIDRVIMGELK